MILPYFGVGVNFNHIQKLQIHSNSKEKDWNLGSLKVVTCLYAKFMYVLWYGNIYIYIIIYWRCVWTTNTAIYFNLPKITTYNFSKICLGTKFADLKGCRLCLKYFTTKIDLYFINSVLSRLDLSGSTFTYKVKSTKLYTR